MRAVAFAGEQQRPFERHADVAVFFAFENPAARFGGKPEPGEKIVAGGVFHLVVAHFRGETGLAPFGDFDLVPFRRRGVGGDRDQVEAERDLKIDAERIELVLRGAAHIKNTRALIMHKRDPLQRRRHLREQPVHHLFADFAARLAVHEWFVLRAHVGDLLHDALRAQKRWRHLPLRLQQRQPQMTAERGVLFGDRHIQQMPAAHPPLHRLRAQRRQRRRRVLRKPLHRVRRQFADDVQHTKTHGTTFK